MRKCYSSICVSYHFIPKIYSFPFWQFHAKTLTLYKFCTRSPWVALSYGKIMSKWLIYLTQSIFDSKKNFGKATTIYFANHTYIISNFAYF